MADSKSDALSKITGLSGLPKSAMMYNSGAQAMAVGVTIMAYDTVWFNYGPFTPSVYPGFPLLLQGWVINEPGIYEIVSLVGVTSGGQWLRFGMGGTALPVPVENSRLANSTAGIDTLQYTSVGQFRAGDVVVSTTAQGAPAQPAFATYNWLYIEKKGGQY